jgi:SAM-dependent methyltransferase
MTILDEIKQYWDDDAASYDDSPGHRPTSAAVRAAWTAALADLLPSAPARVLDCGAGTGFLSLIAARLGHAVTALDLSPKMLERLHAAAVIQGLDIEVVHAPADEPPTGFDVVIERHLLWTLPDPRSALRAWLAAAPRGRLVAIESMWGRDDPLEAVRGRGRELLRRLRRTPSDHHRPYPNELRRALPMGSGTHPRTVATLVTGSGWPNPRLVRLRDVEWTARLELPLPDRFLGVSPRFAVVADAAQVLSR